jgi:hypothetical protein
MVTVAHAIPELAAKLAASIKGRVSLWCARIVEQQMRKAAHEIEMHRALRYHLANRQSGLAIGLADSRRDEDGVRKPQQQRSNRQ